VKQQDEQNDHRYRHAEQPEQNRGHCGSSLNMITLRKVQFGNVTKGFKGFRNAWRLCHAGVSMAAPAIIPARVGTGIDDAARHGEEMSRMPSISLA
jgi:hypothetical protein